MRFEVLDYYNSLRLSIPVLIDCGKERRYRVTKDQVEAACEFVYLQIHEKGFDPFAPGLKLGPYILNRAKKIRMGHYYKVNLGDPVLLNDLTAIKTLENNLLQNNIDKANLRDRLYRWQFSFAMLLTLIVSVILNMVF